MYDLMEDAATSEISRSQLWQWLHHGVGLDDGRTVTWELCHALFDDEMEKIRGLVGEERFTHGHYRLARSIMAGIVSRDEFTEFLTLAGYEHLD